jgi:hypothetical protein
VSVTPAKLRRLPRDDLDPIAIAMPAFDNLLIVVAVAAAAPAREQDSSSSGVSPLVPTAPTTSPSTSSGMPPMRQLAP